MHRESGIPPLTPDYQSSLLNCTSTDARASEDVLVSSYCGVRIVTRNTKVPVQLHIPSPEASAKPSDITLSKHTITLPDKDGSLSLPAVTDLSDEICKEVTRQLQTSHRCRVFFVTNRCSDVRFTPDTKKLIYRYGITKSEIDNAFSLCSGIAEAGKHPSGFSGRYYFVNNPRINRSLMKLTHEDRLNPFNSRARILFSQLDPALNIWAVATHQASGDIPDPLVHSRYITVWPKQCGWSDDNKRLYALRLSANLELYKIDESARCFNQTLNVFYHTLNSNIPDNSKVAFLRDDLMSPEASDRSEEEDSTSNKTHKANLSAREFLLRNFRYAPSVTRNTPVPVQPHIPSPEASTPPSDMTLSKHTITLVDGSVSFSLPPATALSDEICQEVTCQLQTSKKCQVFFVTNQCTDVRFTPQTTKLMYQNEITKSEIDNAFSLSRGVAEASKHPCEFSGRYFFVNNPRINRFLMSLTREDRLNPFKSRARTLFLQLDPVKNVWAVATHQASGDIPDPLVHSRYITVWHKPCGWGEDYKRLYALRLSANLELYKFDESARRFNETLNVFYHTLNSNMPDNNKVVFLRDDLMSPEAPDRLLERDSASNKTQEASLSAQEFLLRIRYAPGGLEYQALCEKRSRYKQGIIE